MRKRPSSIGNSLGLVIEKAILDLLDTTKETELSVHTDGKRLIIEPVRDQTEHRRRVAAASKRVTKKHGKLLAKLAR